jgi:DNA-binding response OmpR family regulator
MDRGVAPPARTLTLSDCSVDLAQRRILRGGETVSLTAREAQLLAYLAQRPGQIVTREELYQRVWGFADTVVSRAIDFTVCRLRAKLERRPEQPVHLFTERGVGYRLEHAVLDAPPRVSTPGACRTNVRADVQSGGAGGEIAGNLIDEDCDRLLP